MNITYLIGNGFDVNLGIKTSYSDFYEYYKKCPSKSSAIKEIKDDIKDHIENWADLEIRLGQLTDKYKLFEKFNEVYRDIYYELNKYIKEQDSTFNAPNEVSRFYNDLINPENYIPDPRRGDIQNYKYKGESDYWYINFITFNYTRTLEKLFQGLKGHDKIIGESHNKSNRPIILSNIEHIHGSIDKNDILLGVNDISQITNVEFQKNKKVLDLFVKTQINKDLYTYVDVECENIIRNSNIICIYGLSLGDTDNHWWEEIGKNYVNHKIIYFDYIDKMPDFIGDKATITQEHLEKLVHKISPTNNIKSDNIYIAINQPIFQSIKPNNIPNANI